MKHRVFSFTMFEDRIWTNIVESDNKGCVERRNLPTSSWITNKSVALCCGFLCVQHEVMLPFRGTKRVVGTCRNS